MGAAYGPNGSRSADGDWRLLNEFSPHCSGHYLFETQPNPEQLHKLKNMSAFPTAVFTSLTIDSVSCTHRFVRLAGHKSLFATISTLHMSSSLDQASTHLIYSAPRVAGTCVLFLLFLCLFLSLMLELKLGLRFWQDYSPRQRHHRFDHSAASFSTMLVQRHEEFVKLGLSNRDKKKLTTGC